MSTGLIDGERTELFLCPQLNWLSRQDFKGGDWLMQWPTAAAYFASPRQQDLLV
jgi:hypothetical protein